MIQRYYPTASGMQEHPTNQGGWVVYSEHKRIVDQLQIELENARNDRNHAYNKGLRAAMTQATLAKWGKEKY